MNGVVVAKLIYLIKLFEWGLTNKTFWNTLPQTELPMPAPVLFSFFLVQVIKALLTEYDEQTLFGLPSEFDDHTSEVGDHDSDTEGRR